MQLGDAEFRQHLHDCLPCRYPTLRHIRATQYRPHTMSPSCWCIGPNLPRACEIDIPAWRNLPKVEYI